MDALTAEISALDTAVFDSFNHCADDKQFRIHESYFAPDLEFYHDVAGVTWSRKAMLANTRKNACGHYRRELVAGSLKIFPIKNFGAIEQGSHLFCHEGSDRCEGIADFMIVWRHRDGKWQITRALSYGHRAND